MTTPALPEDACGGRVRLRCATCGALATLEPAGGELRITCSRCSSVRTLAPWTEGRKLHFPAALEVVREYELALWFSTDFRGHELWALDEAHLSYLRRYVASTRRSADFPSEPGARQPADKFPDWLTSAKNREQLLARLDRLLATVTA